MEVHLPKQLRGFEDEEHNPYTIEFVIKKKQNETPYLNVSKGKI